MVVPRRSLWVSGVEDVAEGFTGSVPASPHGPGSGLLPAGSSESFSLSPVFHMGLGVHSVPHESGQLTKLLRPANHPLPGHQAAEKEAALAQQEEEKAEQRKKARAEKKALKKKKKARGGDKRHAEEDDEKEWGDEDEGEPHVRAPVLQRRGLREAAETGLSFVS